MVHKPGTKIIPSDILSQRPDFEKAPPKEDKVLPQISNICSIMISPITETQLAEAQQANSRLQPIQSLWNTNPKAVDHDWTKKGKLMHYQGKIYIPKKGNFRTTITKSVHNVPTYRYPRIF